jgi:hypothetical protein
MTDEYQAGTSIMSSQATAGDQPLSECFSRPTATGRLWIWGILPLSARMAGSGRKRYGSSSNAAV